MRIGVLGSSGGSAFAAFHDIVIDAFPGKYGFIAATDRRCGFERVCEERDIPFLRVDGDDDDAVSRDAAEFLESCGAPDLVVLYLLRLTTRAIYERFPTFNIHPSLLPAFPGLEPVDRALAAGVKFFGATLHRVAAGVDDGPIVAQVVMPVAPAITRERLEKYSYLQKVYCGLLLVDMVERGQLSLAAGGPTLGGEYESTDRSNPSLTSRPLLERFRALERQEGVVAL